MAGYEVGSAYLSILPSTDGFSRQLTNQLTGPFGSAGRTGGLQLSQGVAAGGRQPMASTGRTLAGIMVGAFAAIGAADIVSAVVGWMQEAITAASDLAETQNKVNEIFGDGAATILAYSETAARELGQSQTTFLDGAANLGIFGQSAGLAGEDLAAFSTDLVRLATDMASFSNTSPEDAIQAIGAALRGEAEPIRRYGVLLDDATLKARALTLGIYEGTGTLTQQQRVLAAQAEILAQTNTQQGDYARTADSFANQQRRFNAEIENFQATVGMALLPVLEDLFGIFLEVGMPILEEFAGWLKDNPDVARAFVVGTVRLLLNLADGFLAFGDVATQTFGWVVDGARWMVDRFLEFVQSFVYGATIAFGWIPEVGDNLRGAGESIRAFRETTESNFDVIDAQMEWSRQNIAGVRDTIHEMQDALNEIDGSTATVTLQVNDRGGLLNYYGGRDWSIEGRATGGPVVAGRPYVVGENGPEIFAPGVSGTILNRDQIAAMGGAGGGDTYYIYEQHDPAGTAYEVSRRQAMRRV